MKKKIVYYYYIVFTIIYAFIPDCMDITPQMCAILTESYIGNLEN